MRPPALTLALTLALPLPALADTPLQLDLQDNLPFLDRAEVAGGLLWTEPSTFGDRLVWELMFNGQPVGLADTHVHIQAVIPRPEFEGEDLVFVTVAGGGNACPTLWAIIVTSAAGARASEPFGTCSEAIVNPRLTMDALVAFDMAPVTDYQPWRTYTADGTDIWASDLPAAP